MKTSTKLLVAAIVIFIIATGIYNSALKAEYLTGNFKKPYHNYNKLNIKDFTEIEVNGSNLVNVEFKQGDFAVYNYKFNEDSILFTKVGNKLIITVNTKGPVKLDTNKASGVIYPQSGSNDDNRLTIICPKLSRLTATNLFLENGKPSKIHDMIVNPVVVYTDTSATVVKTGNGKKSLVTDYNRVSGDYYHYISKLELSNFNADSLSIIQNSNSKVVIEGSVINSLSVRARALSAVSISGSIVNNANLQINAGAQLTTSARFKNVSYHISDSARVNISGPALKSFIK